MKECNDFKLLVRNHGNQRAKMIRRRLDDLRAIETLNDIKKLPQTRCHELKGDKKGLLALDLNHPFRLIIQPNHDPVPRKADGGIDWEGVTSIVVVSVEDYHG